MPERLTCEQCGADFQDADELHRHGAREHGDAPSPAEASLAAAVDDPERRQPDQADLLAGLGKAEDPPGEDEAYDRLEREVHRPPTPGPQREP